MKTANNQFVYTFQLWNYKLILYAVQYLNKEKKGKIPLPYLNLIYRSYHSSPEFAYLNSDINNPVQSFFDTAHS